MFANVIMGQHSSWTAKAMKRLQNKNCNWIITQVSTEKQLEFLASFMSSLWNCELYPNINTPDISEN